MGAWQENIAPTGVNFQIEQLSSLALGKLRLNMLNLYEKMKEARLFIFHYNESTVAGK